MLLRPSTCTGCPLHTTSHGFMQAEGRPELGVALIAEALGEAEAKHSRPLIGPAGLRLGKMIERAGFTREQFLLLNSAWCRPMHPYPNAEPPDAAVDHCRQYWEPLVRKPEVKVIVPMGNIPLRATLALDGILSKRGYVWWSEQYQAFVLPSVHPSFIMRGNSNWEAAFIYDLRHAVEVAEQGWEPIERDYSLDPSPNGAMAWAQRYADVLRAFPTCALGYDIETPDKSESEDETDINLGYQAGPIYRIGFAYVDPITGITHVLSIPWDASYLDVIRFLFGLSGPKVVAYRHFDVPRIQAHGIAIVGDRHDVQEMWHVLHSDLPKRIEHMAPYLCPRQPAWKHLSASQPALYNGIDAGVEIEMYWALRRIMAEAGVWEAYHEHVFGLNPILLFMGEQGMPIDLMERKKASAKLMALKEDVRVKLNDAAAAARPKKIYAKRPKKDGESLAEITIDKEEKYCSDCGKINVNKKHPCFAAPRAEGEVPLGELLTRTVKATGYVKPLDFKPSQKGLINYCNYRGYKLITRWDRETQSRKVSMDENAIRRYALQHTDDPIFALCLEERELNKLLGTYVGRLTDEPPKQLTREQEWHQAFARAAYTNKDEHGNVIGRKLVHLGTEVSGDLADDDDIPF